jgi:hypothetical protein
MTYSGIALYNTTPSTSNATLFTSSAGNVLKQIILTNTTGTAAVVTLYLVRKGGTTSSNTTITLASALSVPANGIYELLELRLGSEYSELQFMTGDMLQGSQGTGSAISVLAYGN